MKKLIFLFLVFLQVTVFANGKTESLASDYFEIANAYAELKNYQKAIYFYKKASQDSAYKNSCDYNLARMYALENDWENACKSLYELYKKDPNNKIILSAYAYTLLGSGNIGEAKKIYKQIATENTENPEDALNYIRLLIFSNDFKKASEEIKKALLNFPLAKEKSVFEKLQSEIDTKLNEFKNENIK